MYRKELLNEGITIPSGASETSPFKTVCPKCNTRKGGGVKDKDLSVLIEKGEYKCHNTNCGWKGNCRPFDSKYKKPEFKGSVEVTPEINRFFQSRGISERVLQKVGVSYDKGMIYFNYYEDGALINYKARSRDKTTFFQSGGAKKTFYNIDSVVGKDTVIIVEGEIDVLTLVEADLDDDYGVISIDSGAGNPPSEGRDGDKLDGKLECLKNCADRLKHVKEFILFLDFDGPGQYTQEELVRRLGEYRCKVLKPLEGIKDANDFFGIKDISHEVQIHALQNYIKSAKPVPIPGIHILEDKLQQKMYDYFIYGKPKAVPTGVIPRENFKWLKGDITLFTGRPSSGKSIFLRWLAYNMSLRNDWKWGCYCPEDYPVYEFYDDLCHMRLSKTVEEGYANRCTLDEYKQGLEWVSEHFFALMPEPNNKNGKTALPTLDWINDQLNFLTMKYGVNAYIKDPWNKIMHKFQGREDEYLAVALSEEKFFASKYDAACYVAHPPKLMKTKAGKYEAPSPYEISGGAMWFNMIDNLFVCHRADYDTDRQSKGMDLICHKIKKQKRVGLPEDHRYTFSPSENKYTYVNTLSKALVAEVMMGSREDMTPDGFIAPKNKISSLRNSFDKDDFGI